MRIALMSEAHTLELTADESGECRLDLIGPEGRERLGRDPTHRVRARFLGGLQRALSDEFTVVGTVDGVPVVLLLAFDAASTVLYVTMDTRTVIVQETEGGRVLGKLAVDRAVLAEWIETLRDLAV